MNAVDERRSARTIVVISATLEWGHDRIAVLIKNLSAHGALVVGKGLPPAEADIKLHYMGKKVAGWIPWSRGSDAGVAFDEAVEPEWTHRTSSFAHPLIVRDTRSLDCKRPGFRGMQLNEEEAQIVEEWNRANSSRT